MAETARNKPHYTYRNYAGWPDDERWELIDGRAYNMTPAPTTAHQAVTTRLVGILFGLLRDHRCSVFTSPLDILLPVGEEEDEDVGTTVQPDIVVICRPEIIRKKNIRGAPDWVIEVLSPSTAKKDEGIKRDCYQRAGVKEYWLAHPTDQTLIRYRLRDGAYGLPEVFGHDDRIDLPVPEGAGIDLAEVFDTGIALDRD
ncbi:MAG: Uma2 family endonuclease [Gammaproteobacteria bacterium]|nr:Uma2 family endonuclease [Gammaproteobacteria bacterium]